MISDSQFKIFQDEFRRKPGLNWYAIADDAQHKNLHALLMSEDGRARCLFEESDGGLTAQFSPHLVTLEEPSEKNKVWSWILNNARRKPCVSIVSTDRDFTWVFDKLVGLAEVELPDQECMFLAFWDPAILGVLVGQEDDLTLHVKGPVLSSEQREHFVFGLTGWWYWSRSGQLHEIDLRQQGKDVRGKQILMQHQVDDLVEASVPDHILYFLNRYQKPLLQEIPMTKHYEFVCEALHRGRAFRLRLDGRFGKLHMCRAILRGKNV